MATADHPLARLSLFVVPIVLALGIGVWAWAGQDERIQPAAVTSRPPTTSMVEVAAESAFEFGSIAEMARASDLVVVGEVVATERGRLVGDPAGGGVVSRIVTLRVDDVVWDAAGVDPSVVMVEEEGWLPDGSTLVVNGVAPSRVGDAGLWFLDDVSDADVPTYLVINSQGRFLGDDAGVIGGDQSDALVQAAQQHSIAELVSDVRGAIADAG